MGPMLNFLPSFIDCIQIGQLVHLHIHIGHGMYENLCMSLTKLDKDELETAACNCDWDPLSDSSYPD